MSRLIAQQTPNNIAKPLPIAKGGTGQKNAAMALQALGGIPADAVAHPLGPVPLNSDSKIPLVFIPPIQGSATLSIYGPVQAFCSVLTKYWLSDFDIGTTYNVSCVDGVVSISGNEIHYTTPATPGNYGFTVNGRSFQVNAINSYIDKPVITTPINDFVSHLSTIPITFSFQDYGPRPNNSVSFCTIERANDALFTQNVTTTSYINFNVNALTLDNLVRDSDYYVRVKVSFVDGINNNIIHYSSQWSDTIHFTTGHFLEFGVFNILASNFVSASNMFGDSVSIDNSGTWAIIGSPYRDVVGGGDSGYVDIFKKINGIWQNMYPGASLQAPTPQLNGKFGYSLAISGDGTRIVVGEPGKTITGFISAGIIYVYVRTNDTWSLETTIQPPSPYTSYQFGYQVDINYDGSRILVSEPLSDSASLNEAGAAYIFVRNGNAWTQEKRLRPNDIGPLDGTLGQFGTSITMSKDGTCVAIANIRIPTSIYIFKYNGSDWIFHSKIVNTLSSSLSFSSTNLSLAFNYDGTRLVYGDKYGNGGLGGFKVFDLNNNIYQETLVNINTMLPSNTFLGNSIDMNANGDVIVIGGFNYEANYGRRGAVLSLTYENGAWNEQLLPSYSSETDSLGISISINGSGDEFISGSATSSFYGVSGAGSASAFRRR